MRTRILLALCLGAALSVAAQTTSTSDSTTTNTTTQTPDATANPQNNGNLQVEPMEKTPVFRVNVVQRSTSAVNYRHRSGQTKVDFKGTTLMPEATGAAKVEGKAGRLEINADFRHLRPARDYGAEYLTYVLWAITPQGRPVNLGEILLDKDRAWTRVTTDLQAFGMIVTAEPYYSVTRPSDMVVMENVVRQDTAGFEQPITAKFDALERGEYTIDMPARSLPATFSNPGTPLELLEARNAVAIAKASGAEKYAPDALSKAQDFLARGEDYLNRKQNRSAIATVARGATQAAEDARILTIRRKHDEQLAQQRREQQERLTQAQQNAQAEAQRAQEARLQADEAAQRAREAEADRQAADQARAEAEAAADRARQERAAADQARAQLQVEQQQLQAQAQQAQLRAQQAEQDREQMRARLLQQLNQVLQTRDTARGLIVNMSDVLFDTGKATLKPGARERLARVAGIVLAYPDLKLQIEGHTDSVGSDQYNLSLSQRRADAVRAFLANQGVPQMNITAQGFGKADPVASNATPTGRQLNRRVDLVVSGQAIATQAGPGFRVNNNSGTSAGSAAAGSGGVSGTAGVQSGLGPSNSRVIGNTSGAVGTNTAPAQTGNAGNSSTSTTVAPDGSIVTTTTSVTQEQVPADGQRKSQQQQQQTTPPPPKR